MRRNLLSVVVVSTVLSLLSSSVQAQDPVKQIFSDIFGGIAKKAVEDIESSINKSRNKRKRRAAERATLTAGYCQIWKNEKLKVQRRCNSTNYCTDQNCTFKYVWPNGRATKVIMQNGTPVALNGRPTGYTYVGDDPCFTDGRPTNIFCFTPTKQSSNLFSVYSSPAITQTPVQTTRIPVSTTPGRVPAPANPGPSEFDVLVDAYVTASENPDDPETKNKRCRLGGKLLFQHGSSLDDETKGIIRDQMKNDNCLG